MNSQPQKAFTLVESMVAIAIVAIALVGPFTAVQSALSGSYIARDRLIAATLAQEGLEYIRSIRDNNYLSNRSWTYGFSSSQNSRNQCFGDNPTGYCTIDSTQGDFNISGNENAMIGYASNQVANMPPLYINSAQQYTQISTGNTATVFTRKVQLQTIPDTVTHEMKVLVTVSWTTAHQTFSITVTDVLQDWL